MPLLQSTWQVPWDWRKLAPWQTGLLYGLGLGPGFTTRVTTTAFHVLMAGVIAFGSTVTGMALFGVYAAGRWFGIAAVVTRGIKDFDQLDRRLLVVVRWRPRRMLRLGSPWRASWASSSGDC